MNWLRRAYRRVRDWFVRLLHLDDTPHRIAMGAAVGMFVALTPTIGLQMLLVLLVLCIIPGNRAAGLPMVWLTNPATALPVYYFNYRVGAFFLGEPAGVNMQKEWRLVIDTVPPMGDLFTGPASWFSEMTQWLGTLWQATESIVAQLWLGSVIVGLVAGAVTYGLMYYLVVFYRRRIREGLHRLAHLRDLRRHRHAERRQRHAARDAAKAAEKTEGHGGTTA